MYRIEYRIYSCHILYDTFLTLEDKTWKQQFKMILTLKYQIKYIDIAYFQV